jgi:hypothetical protein
LNRQWTSFFCLRRGLLQRGRTPLYASSLPPLFSASMPMACLHASMPTACLYTYGLPLCLWSAFLTVIIVIIIVHSLFKRNVYLSLLGDLYVSFFSFFFLEIIFLFFF